MLSFLLLIMGLACPHLSQPALRVPVFAHYADWHVKNPNHSSWVSSPAYTHPLAGTYDSLDPSIIVQHNKMFEENGIVPLISWWGPQMRSGDEFLDNYLLIDSPVQFGILYEATDRLTANKNGEYDFNDPKNIQRFVDDMAHIQNKYFSKPEYQNRFYRMDGRPVIFIWITQAFVGNFADAVKQARGVSSFYLIGSDFNIFGSVRPDMKDLIGGYDALSSYGIYAPELATQFNGHVNADYLAIYLRGVGIWSKWLHDNVPNVHLILPLQFTYHDNRGNPLMTETTPEEAQNLASAALAQINNAYCRHGNIMPWVLVVSFNEHYEGSAIEPSVEYGDTFLSVINHTFNRSDAVSQTNCDCENPH